MHGGSSIDLSKTKITLTFTGAKLQLGSPVVSFHCPIGIAACPLLSTVLYEVYCRCLYIMVVYMLYPSFLYPVPNQDAFYYFW